MALFAVTVDYCASMIVEISSVPSGVLVIDTFSVIGKSFVAVVGSFVVDIVVLDPSVAVLGDTVVTGTCMYIHPLQFADL